MKTRVKGRKAAGRFAKTGQQNSAAKSDIKIWIIAAILFHLSSRKRERYDMVYRGELKKGAWEKFPG